MIKISNGIKIYLKDASFLCVLLPIILSFSMAGCSNGEHDKHYDLSYFKGKHILVVIDEFNRNPDVIEDWSDYKRYTWHQCKNTGRPTIDIRDVDSYYLKSEIICCDIQFETDRKNIIFGYKGSNTCPISDSLKHR